MKNLRLNLGAIAIVAGGILAISNSIAQPKFSLSTYEATHNNASPPTRANTIALPNAPSSYCGAGASTNCAAKFDVSTGAYSSGTLVTGTFSN